MLKYSFPLAVTMNEEYVSAILASPPGDIHLLLTSGNSIRFGDYFDKATKKSLVRCDVCEKFIVLGATRSTSKLKNPELLFLDLFRRPK
jgi:hypothetical protein